MNPTIRNLPGHAFAPGHQPRGSFGAEGWTDRLMAAAGNVLDLAMPFLMALSGVLLVWVILETMRARSRARKRAALGPASRVPETAEVRTVRVPANQNPPTQGDRTQAPHPLPSRGKRKREPFTRASLNL
jgi:hypothetical protein